MRSVFSGDSLRADLSISLDRDGMAVKNVSELFLNAQTTEQA